MTGRLISNRESAGYSPKCPHVGSKRLAVLSSEFCWKMFLGALLLLDNRRFPGEMGLFFDNAHYLSWEDQGKYFPQFST